MKRKRRIDDDSDSEAEVSKFACNDNMYLQQKLDSIDSKVSKILEINPNLPLPLGLSTILLDSLRCHICKSSPIVPPPIFTSCCRRILGCQGCVDSWYRMDDPIDTMKKCPLCRGERGYANTFTLLGLDDLLKYVSKAMRVTPDPADRPVTVVPSSPELLPELP